MLTLLSSLSFFPVLLFLGFVSFSEIHFLEFSGLVILFSFQGAVSVAAHFATRNLYIIPCRNYEVNTNFKKLFFILL